MSDTSLGATKKSSGMRAPSGWINPRLFLLAVVLGVALLPGAFDVTLTALGDAFLQVTVFVGATLALVFFAERYFAVDLGELMGRAKYMQGFYASLLGATPGCGGAIIVVTQFTHGKISFGSVVAVLIATMGDAAFLLIAREPKTAVMVLGVSLVAGTLSGWVVDAIHGTDFLRPKVNDNPTSEIPRALPKPVQALDWVWIGMVVLAIPFSIAIAMQIDANAWFGAFGGLDPVRTFGVVGAILSLIIWALKPGWSGQNIHDAGHSVRRRVVDDTSFVTAWVVMAFLGYEVLVHFTGVEIGTFFGAFTPIMPLVGVLVGLIPGCGPQIVVTTLYLAGAIPLSAQFANSIANDGDALFPAIALVPKAAFLATLYSAIPALIVGYGYMFLFERG